MVIDDTDVITIDWGVLCSREANSGTYFGDEMRGTNISVYPQTGGAGSASDWRVYVIHEYFQAVQYSPASGGGSLAVVINN